MSDRSNKDGAAPPEGLATTKPPTAVVIGAGFGGISVVNEPILPDVKTRRSLC